jgi:hypothetical protein
MLTAIVVVWTIAIVGIAVATSLVRSRRQRGARVYQEEQGVVYSTAVALKIQTARFGQPRWSMGAAGFSLVISSDVFSIFGPSTWYFKGSECTIESDRTRTLWGGTQNWIRIESNDHKERVLISPIPASHFQETWMALRMTGATISA